MLKHQSFLILALPLITISLSAFNYSKPAADLTKPITTTVCITNDSLEVINAADELPQFPVETQSCSILLIKILKHQLRFVLKMSRAT
ncbi:hypothetical protein SAMN06265350_10724 [Solitalea koreensis]|uniref:Uncharacterized protein n=1 Tax=Solitalea koreensis TaxID=543615 RepID=A0A521DK24_9SPHI|nr:hypothetical protein SAMN06265350_10724 [Solitalea koreensis]